MKRLALLPAMMPTVACGAPRATVALDAPPSDDPSPGESHTITASALARALSIHTLSGRFPL